MKKIIEVLTSPPIIPEKEEPNSIENFDFSEDEFPFSSPEEYAILLSKKRKEKRMILRVSKDISSTGDLISAFENHDDLVIFNYI